MTILIILAMFSETDTVEQDGVRIATSVRSSAYSYTVTNLGSNPITEIVIDQNTGFNFKVPNGWEFDGENNVFRAWATDPRFAIHNGQTREFTFRASTKGTVLARVDAAVKLASGESVALPRVWGPLKESRGFILLVAGVVLAMFGLHCALAVRADRREKPAR